MGAVMKSVHQAATSEIATLTVQNRRGLTREQVTKHNETTLVGGTSWRLQGQKEPNQIAEK